MMEGPGADSEEKHEPVSDIDTVVVVVGLKALDPEWPIREAMGAGVLFGSALVLLPVMLVGGQAWIPDGWMTQPLERFSPSPSTPPFSCCSSKLSWARRTSLLRPIQLPRGACGRGLGRGSFPRAALDLPGSGDGANVCRRFSVGIPPPAFPIVQRLDR